MSHLHYVGYHATTEGVQLESLYPLPRIRYKLTEHTGRSHMSCDTTDTVTEPVAVVPSTMAERDYYIPTSDRQRRNSLTLLVTPVGFIFRDDWDYLSPNTELSSFYNRLNRNFDLSNYATASQDRKREIYAEALGVLWAAGKKESGQDEELVVVANEGKEQDDVVVEEQELEY